MSLFSGVRVIAVLEAAKGGLVVLAGFGLFALIHRNVQAMADAMVERFHLNPAGRYPSIFLEAAGAVTDARLWLIAVGAVAYAVVRFVEAYGLWRHRRWAEWFAALSGAVYMPLEVYELAHGVTWSKVATLLVNAVIVGYMSYELLQGRRRLHDSASASSPRR